MDEVMKVIIALYLVRNIAEKLGAFISVFLLVFSCASAQQTPVTIRVNASKPIGDMKPFWAYFGYDEHNYTYRENGRKLLSELQQLSPVPVYVRTHNLLTSKGNSQGPDLKWGFTDAYKEDTKGNPIYNWTIVDSI